MTTIIVDDDEAIRNGLRRIMEGLGVDVIGEADNGRAAVERAKSLHPELILLDVSMPVMGGFAAAREIRQTMPEILIILVSQHNERAYAQQAGEIGVGYVLKRSAVADLPQALDAAKLGQTFVSPHISSPKVNSQTA